MSLPLNADGTLKPLEVNLPKLNKWRRKDFKLLLRILEGKISADLLDEQDKFLAQYTNWSLAEIEDLDMDETKDIFKAISEAIQDTNVPKANAASSESGLPAG